MTRSKKVSVLEEHPFFHRKVTRSGQSRYIAVSRMIPDDWLIVKVELKVINEKVRTLKITKLD